MKPSGEIRLCGDYKVSTNPYLEINQYPLLHLELLFAVLNGGVQFTKLDLSEAYLQIPLEEQSKKYLVINMHKGLYCFTRLPYGVAVAPSIFQQIMGQILPKLPGVACYIFGQHSGDRQRYAGTFEQPRYSLTEITRAQLVCKEYQVQILAEQCRIPGTGCKCTGY